MVAVHNWKVKPRRPHIATVISLESGFIYSMTNTESLARIEELVASLPGILSAQFGRSNLKSTVYATIRCETLAGFDSLARCGSGANVAVTLGQSESKTFRHLGSVSGLECHAVFDDTKNDRPTTCEIFGFYAAILLYNDSMIDDLLLDELEAKWNVNFSRDKK